MEIEDKKNELWLKGLWIPAEVAFNDKLSYSEKFLFFFIESLDNEKGCFASNDYLSRVMGVSQQTITNGISKLKDLGYIIQTGFNGRKRTLQIDSTYKKRYEQIPKNFISRVKGIYDYINNSLYSIKDISSKEENTLSGDNGVPFVDNSFDRPLLKRRKIPLSEKPKRIPLGIQQILTVWNTSGLRKHENPETKVYQECISKIQLLMKGRFFYENPVANGYQGKEFTRDEIIQAIENFKLAALNLDYEPVGSYKEHLKKMSFTEFLYNPFSQNGERSLFIKYFEAPPKLCSQMVKLPEDQYPVFSKAAMRIYSEKQKRGIGSFTLSDQAKFIKGGEKVYNFYKKNGGKIDQLFIRTDYDKVLLVMEALESQFPQGFEPGNFCSDYTFNEVLPKYLEKQAVLLDDNIFG